MWFGKNCVAAFPFVHFPLSFVISVIWVHGIWFCCNICFLAVTDQMSCWSGRKAILTKLSMLQYCVPIWWCTVVWAVLTGCFTGSGFALVWFSSLSKSHGAEIGRKNPFRWDTWRTITFRQILTKPGRCIYIICYVPIVSQGQRSRSYDVKFSFGGIILDPVGVSSFSSLNYTLYRNS